MDIMIITGFYGWITTSHLARRIGWYFYFLSLYLKVEVGFQSFDFLTFPIYFCPNNNHPNVPMSSAFNQHRRQVKNGLDRNVWSDKFCLKMCYFTMMQKF